jgi:hypothetical protein
VPPIASAMPIAANVYPIARPTGREPINCNLIAVSINCFATINLDAIQFEFNRQSVEDDTLHSIVA